MEAKELRIGNLIQVEGSVISVGMIKEKFISWNVSKYPENKVWNPFISTKDERIKPIRLTEKWLLRFGFKKHKLDGSWWYTKSCGKNKPELITNDIGEGAYSTKLKFVFIDEYDNIEIKNVHQLQNLYFSLTGKELEVKKPELIK